MISACLLGIHCRYDSEHSFCPDLADFAASAPFTVFCPEQLGGLPTPRPPAKISGGDGRDVLLGGANVMNVIGEDVTDSYRKGAEEALRLAKLAGATIAIMKDKSPSCGLRTPYCEKSSGFGVGVTAALFELNGIKIFELGSSDTFPTPGFLKFSEKNNSRAYIKELTEYKINPISRKNKRE